MIGTPIRGATDRAIRPIFRSALVVLFVIAGMLVSRAPATAAPSADPEAERAARAHFRMGETHYAAGKYAEALSEYQAGYDVQPLPGFLVNIAQCQRRMGDMGRARATYGKFVLVAPDSPLVPEVRGLIEELDRLIAETETARSRPMAATNDKDDKDGSDILPPSAIEPTPARPPGAAGADLTASTTQDPSQVSPGTGDGQPPATSSRRRWWFWGTWAAVAAGAATVALVLSAPDARTIHDGSLGTLRR